eukprot:gene22535-9014_t
MTQYDLTPLDYLVHTYCSHGVTDETLGETLVRP